MTTEDFKAGDRVIVTDLRKGTQYRGTITFVGLASVDQLGVRYDNGQDILVGRGFVRKIVALVK